MTGFPAEVVLGMKGHSQIGRREVVTNECVWLASVCVHAYVWAAQHWELYVQRIWDRREDDGVKELKNDRWLDYTEIGSGDWAWNEKKGREIMHGI